MIAAAPGLAASPALRARLADLYGAYDEALAEGQYERWPEFFTEACVYKITSRENYDAGLPIGLVTAESRAMLPTASRRSARQCSTRRGSCAI